MRRFDFLGCLRAAIAVMALAAFFPNPEAAAGLPPGPPFGLGAESLQVTGGTITLSNSDLAHGTIKLTGELLSPLTIQIPTNWGGGNGGELIINNQLGGGGISTLASAMNTTQTNLQLVSAVGYPPAGNYTLQIGGEAMTVVGGQGTVNLTVVRGSTPGTQAAGIPAFPVGVGYFPVYVKYVGQTTAPLVAGQGAISKIVGDGTTIYLQSTTAGNNRNPSAQAPVGDSRFARYYSYNTSGPTYLTNMYSFLGQANMQSLTGQWPIVYLGATSGWRSDQYLASGGRYAGFAPQGGPSPKGVFGLPGAIQSNAKILPIWGLTNDIAQAPTTGATVASLWYNYYNAAETARGAGMDVIFVAETGATAATYTSASTQNPMVYQLNELMKEYVEQAQENPGNGRVGTARYFDISAALMDPAQPSGTIAFKTGYSDDGIHPNETGSRAAGVAYYNFLTSLAIPQSGPWTWTTNDNQQAAGTQLFVNPFFITSTGGTCAGNCSGTAAASWTVNVGGTATAVASVVSDPLGFGNAQKVACTFAAVNDYCRVQQIVTPGFFPANSIMEFGAVVSIDAGSSNCLMPQMLTSSSAGSIRVMSQQPTLTNASQPTTASVYNLRSIKVPFTTAATIGTTVQILVYGYGAGSCTFYVSRPFLTSRKS